MSFDEAGKYFAAMKAKNPFPMPKISIIPTLKAKEYVLANAGATLPKRDPVDTRVVKQVATGKLKFILMLNHLHFNSNTADYQAIHTSKVSLQKFLRLEVTQNIKAHHIKTVMMMVCLTLTSLKMV